MPDVTSVPADLSALFEALGPQTDTVDMVSFDAENASWTVVFDDDLAVLLEWDEGLERLMALSLVGRPTEHAMVTVYQAVLAYNASWRFNGGARIGMVDPDGELALMLDLPTRGLSLEQLQRALLGVRTVAFAWTRMVADPEGNKGAVALPTGVQLA